MKFSYLICHSNTSSYRENNLKALIKYIRQNFKNVEIIVAEQGNSISVIDSVDIHVFNHNDGLFERSKLLNLAVKNANNEYLIIGDNDLIVDVDSINKSIDLLNEYDAINPYSVVRDIPENITNEYINNMDMNILKDQGTYRESIVFAGGMLAIRKSSYIKIGGYDENVIGWGGEDDLMTIKISNLLKYTSLESVSYHLYHDRGINGVPYHEHYDKNVEILTKVQNMNMDELIEYSKQGCKVFV